MRRFAKYFLILGLIMIVLICVPMLVHAQSGNPSDPDCDPLDPACPIDGGVGILIAAGIGYGIKKVKDFRKISRLQ